MTLQYSTINLREENGFEILKDRDIELLTQEVLDMLEN